MAKGINIDIDSALQSLLYPVKSKVKPIIDEVSGAGRVDRYIALPSRSGREIPADKAPTPITNTSSLTKSLASKAKLANPLGYDPNISVQNIRADVNVPLKETLKKDDLGQLGVNRRVRSYRQPGAFERSIERLKKKGSGTATLGFSPATSLGKSDYPETDQKSAR